MNRITTSYIRFFRVWDQKQNYKWDRFVSMWKDQSIDFAICASINLELDPIVVCIYNDLIDLERNLND